MIKYFDVAHWERELIDSHQTDMVYVNHTEDI